MAGLLNTGGSAHIHVIVPEGVLDDFPEEITVTPKTPALSNLFNVRDNKEKELID